MLTEIFLSSKLDTAKGFFHQYVFHFEKEKDLKRVNSSGHFEE